MIHRDLAHAGILPDEAVYSASLLAWAEIA